jgi:hypothetical protein
LAESPYKSNHEVSICVTNCPCVEVLTMAYR